MRVSTAKKKYCPLFVIAMAEIFGIEGVGLFTEQDEQDYYDEHKDRRE